MRWLRNISIVVNFSIKLARLLRPQSQRGIVKNYTSVNKTRQRPAHFEELRSYIFGKDDYIRNWWNSNAQSNNRTPRHEYFIIKLQSFELQPAHIQRYMLRILPLYRSNHAMQCKRRILIFSFHFNFNLIILKAYWTYSDITLHNWLWR